jgi:hypothetical protein
MLIPATADLTGLPKDRYNLRYLHEPQGFLESGNPCIIAARARSSIG